MNYIALSILVFYPLLQPVWEKEPFSEANTTVAESFPFMNDAGLDSQKKFFSQIQDPRIRSQMAMSLSNANNSYAVDVLEYLLQNEKSELVAADILRTLLNFDGLAQCKKAHVLKGMMKSPEPSIRAYSASLYLRASKDCRTVLDALETEQSPFVMNFVWDALASKTEFYANCPSGAVEKFIAHSVMEQRRGAARLLALAAADPDGNTALKTALKDESIPVRANFAKAFLDREKGGTVSLSFLADDKSASVRGTAAAAKAAAERLKIHAKLSGDSDEEVRKTACAALGNYNDSEAVEALLPRLGDASLQVRTAAEEALIKIHPGDDVLKKIGVELLSDEKSRASSVKVLGALVDKRFAPDMLRMLEGTDEKSEAELVRRFVEALGFLDHAEAWKAVSSKSSHPQPGVRKAAAFTLGRLKIRESFDTLTALAEDADPSVSTEAIKSMGLIADASFSGFLTKCIKHTKTDYPADNRSFACWALARIGQPDSAVLKQLEKLCLEKVLPIPGMGPEYDADFVRAAACWTLVEAGRKDEKIKASAASVIAKMLAPPKKAGDQICGEVLIEYIRQADLHMKGEKAEPVQVPFHEPNLIIMELKKQNEN